jgi:molybdopterin synthase catalytic subunit
MIHVGIQAEPIVVQEWIDLVAGDDAGAVAVFLGTVRAHHRGRRVLHLEYEAYRSMAEAEMRRIGQEALRERGALRIALVHRTGRLERGEVSVAVAAAAAHRAEAFDACRAAMEDLKRTVPIWKKEVFEGGEEWIE